jgi:hypothetical protein
VGVAGRAAENGEEQAAMSKGRTVAQRSIYKDFIFIFISPVNLSS